MKAETGGNDAAYRIYWLDHDDRIIDADCLIADGDENVRERVHEHVAYRRRSVASGSSWPGLGDLVEKANAAGVAVPLLRWHEALSAPTKPVCGVRRVP